MTNRKAGRQTDRQTNRRTDGRTDRRTQGEKQFISRPFQGGGIIIHQNETKKSAHVSQLSELKHTSSWATVDDDTTETCVCWLFIKDVTDFRDGYKTYKK